MSRTAVIIILFMLVLQIALTDCTTTDQQSVLDPQISPVPAATTSPTVGKPKPGARPDTLTRHWHQAPQPPSPARKFLPPLFLRQKLKPTILSRLNF
jgi:hypothetical protein